MTIRVKERMKRSNSIRKIFKKDQWKLVGVVVIYLALTLGCRHTNKSHLDVSVSETDADWKPIYAPTEPVTPLSVDDLLMNPETHIDTSVTVVGVVDDLELKKSSKGYRILGIDLRDEKNTTLVEERKESFVRINLLGHLESIGKLLVQSSQEIELSSLEVTVFEDLSYDLKINGNRIRALGNFFRSKEKHKIGNDVELIANGYLKLGDAFYSFSNLAVENNPGSDIEQVDILPNISVENSEANHFQDTIKLVCHELSNFANTLIENRNGLLRGDVVIGNDTASASKGYALLSIGDMFEAKRWESKKSRAEISEHQFDVLSKSYSLMGEGVNDMYDGYQELGKGIMIKTDESETPIKFIYPTLKCAYIGYNKFVLNDCENKVRQLGDNGVVTIKGRLVRGNLHEQLNLLWLKMESVTVDNLTIDLAHNESSSAWRNLTNFYDWMKETTN